MAPDAGTVVRRMDAALCAPQEQRQFLLLFELVSHYSRQSDREMDLAQSLVHDRVRLLADRLITEGWRPEDATALATLLRAQVRGLQLDLLVSGDRARADRAIEFAARLLDRPTA